MKTPEQIADDTTPYDGARMSERAPFTWNEVRDIVIAAIKADRAQPERDGTIHAATISALEERLDFDPANEPETRAVRDAMAWIEQLPDEFWDRFAGPMLDAIEEAARNDELHGEDEE